MICFEFKTGYAIIGRYVIVFAVSNLYTCIMILVIYILLLPKLLLQNMN